jgi:peptidoglycan hydrolase-like amidase
MVQGGSAIKAWFSSTHGGYIFKSSEIGWSDTSWTKHASDFDGSVSSFSDLSSKAFDRDSPWFYCDWGSRSNYNKTAWLREEELADVVNVVLLARADSSTQEHLYQTDKPHPYGGEVWNEDKVKEELKNRGISYFNRVDSGSVGADFSYGKTTSVNFSGDGGSVSFDGAEFKNFFNLRAPANIQIVGPLYNLEKR